MNKKQFVFIQHTLIPWALVLGNVAVIHLIYSLSSRVGLAVPTAVAMSIFLLAFGIVKRNKYFLLSGMLLYSVVLSLSFF